MNILIVNNRLKAGGVETAILEEAKLLSSKGHTVTIYSTDLTSLASLPENINFTSPLYLTPTIHNSNKYLFPLILFIDKIKNLLPFRKVYLKTHFWNAINFSNPEVIHNHTEGHLYNFLLPLFAEISHSIPIIYTSHNASTICPNGTLIKGTDNLDSDLCDGICSMGFDNGKSALTHNCLKNTILKKRSLNSYIYSLNTIKDIFNIITVPSNALKKLITDSGKLSNDRIYILNYPLAQSFFNRTISTKKEKTYFLFSGRLIEEKGCTLLIDIFSELDIPLVIVGDGPLKKALKNEIKLKNIQNITMVGWKNDKELEELYQNAYATIVPSVWFENYPLVIQEAFSYGKPVIGSINGGIPDLVKHEETGLLFERNNVEQLRECIIRLWNDPELTQRLGKNAYDFLHKNNHPDVIYPQLMEIFEKALEINKQKQRA